MEKVKWNSVNKVNRHEKEKNSGEVLVETAGFLKRSRKIQVMLEAGQKLGEMRKDMYDFPEDFDFNQEVNVPVERTPGFDMADASTLLYQIGENVKRRRRERIEEAKALEREKKQETEGEARPEPEVKIDSKDTEVDVKE